MKKDACAYDAGAFYMEVIVNQQQHWWQQRLSETFRDFQLVALRVAVNKKGAAAYALFLVETIEKRHWLWEKKCLCRHRP